MVSIKAKGGEGRRGLTLLEGFEACMASPENFIKCESLVKYNFLQQYHNNPMSGNV